MTQAEIIEMAREAGLKVDGDYFSDDLYRAVLTRFAKMVDAKATAREREECAKLVESLPPVGVYRQLERATFKDAATAIRARGERQ
jgi:hypothetical protein